MFVRALFPTDKHFLSKVALEVEDVVVRISNHPSVILWAGNSENELALAADWFNIRKELPDPVMQETYR
jgi:beta-mannosidase